MPRAARHASDHQLGLGQRHSFVRASDAHSHPRGYFPHDQWGNIIAELDATGATLRWALPTLVPRAGRKRIGASNIWLVEAEIAHTRGSRTNVDRPVAVVSNVSTTPALLMVHVDQLHRPMKMTDASGAVVWSAVYAPFGGAYTLSGSETLNARFPG